MKDRVLVSFSTYNRSTFLEHLVESIGQYDAGYPFDLLIYDNSSTDSRQLSLLEKYSKKYRVETRPNVGRAQGAYADAWQNNKDYKYYFFMHDDSAILRDNWLKIAVDRINDNSIENILKDKKIEHLPVGKVGFQAYEWGSKYKYLRTGHPQIFNYMDPIAKILNVKIPPFYQHINDDRYLIKNELLQHMGYIWNIETWKQMEENFEKKCTTCDKSVDGNDFCSNAFHLSSKWKQVDEWFTKSLPNKDPFPPEPRYGWKYHAFQTVSEFLSDIAPMRYEYRTHCVVGDGYCQEELGWSKFWGLEYVTHYGCHNLFKRMAILLNTTEEQIRARFKDKTFLTICDNIVKKETEYVVR